MPQLDVSTYASQLFWLAVCFSILYWTLKNRIIPRLDQIRQDRWEHTEGMQRKAGTLQEEAEGFNAQWKKSLDDARKQSNELVNQAVQKSRLNLSQKRAEFSDLIQRRLGASKAKLHKQEADVQNRILEKLAPLTTEMVLKVSQETLPRNRVEKAVEKALSSAISSSKIRRA
ncbi:MAG: hypothetical protein GY915_00625 [bacterium]|nr:hypothetical protein [bacterium]